MSFASRKFARRAALFATAFSLALPAMAQAEEVVVFAAASMKNALDEVAAKFQEETGNTVVISYAGSNALAKQIIEGAPADIFISAAVNWMDEVEKAGLVVEGAREDLLGNTLVLVAHGKDAAPVEIGEGFDLKALLGDEKLAMALIDSVPAGQYGKAALEHLGQWGAVEGSVAQADNVRATLALVAQGEAPYGIVYATDAVAEDNVTVVGTFPADSHKPIVYPAALLTGAADAADRAFYEALSGDEAHRIFAAEGFSILN
ncbi:molybdate ABC transporter substrate-binding protein [Pseudomonas sp. GX19020]|uniref:molybdate ABC transporter substrate-binding protein n=1 Tax=Pseudomonadota TaxID=1224 RepID=UPI000899978C|nr:MULTISPECIES: molybdate ABC transporter substrate-binding protein [Pseudomonadota]MCL4067826.1 molybdate ABC transporter substrate-binding protein [Pseudomonas sp. GX19020]SEC42435.1 molybdate transport system substrate-binding protein [Rhodobacter sp. 24-YEA-8]